MPLPVLAHQITDQTFAGIEESMDIEATTEAIEVVAEAADGEMIVATVLAILTAITVEIEMIEGHRIFETNPVENDGVASHTEVDDNLLLKVEHVLLHTAHEIIETIAIIVTVEMYHHTSKLIALDEVLATDHLLEAHLRQT